MAALESDSIKALERCRCFREIFKHCHNQARYVSATDGCSGKMLIAKDKLSNVVTTRGCRWLLTGFLIEHSLQL
jgi:hypothetical protein